MFGDGHAISALGDLIDGMPKTIEKTDGEKLQTSDSTTDTFDDHVKNVVVKMERRQRKSAPDDIQLMAESYQKTHDPRTWQHLQERLYKPLLKYLMTMTSNTFLAEDACAFTFVQAYKYIDEYDPSKSKFSTWVWTIGYRNLLYDMKIERRLETVSMNTLGYVEEVTTENEGSYDSDSRSDEMSIDYYMVEDMKIEPMSCDTVIRKIYDVSINAINDIENPITKQVVESKIVNNMTIKEISIMMNMNQSNVKNHLYKGKQELAYTIKKENPDLYDLYLDAMYEKDLAAG